MCVFFDGFRQILNSAVISASIIRVPEFDRVLTVVDDEGNVGDLRIFNLNVVHDEDLRRQLPHQPSRWTSKPVQGGELCRGVHVTVL